jgi:hypothetical protein
MRDEIVGRIIFQISFQCKIKQVQLVKLILLKGINRLIILIFLVFSSHGLSTYFFFRIFVIRQYVDEFLLHHDRNNTAFCRNGNKSLLI